MNTRLFKHLSEGVITAASKLDTTLKMIQIKNRYTISFSKFCEFLRN